MLFGSSRRFGGEMISVRRRAWCPVRLERLLRAARPALEPPQAVDRRERRPPRGRQDAEDQEHRACSTTRSECPPRCGRLLAFRRICARRPSGAEPGRRRLNNDRGGADGSIRACCRPPGAVGGAAGEGGPAECLVAVAGKAQKCRRSCSVVRSSASGSTFTSPRTGMKLVSPLQRGTTCMCTCSSIPAPAARPRFQPTLNP